MSVFFSIGLRRSNEEAGPELTVHVRECAFLGCEIDRDAVGLEVFWSPLENDALAGGDNLRGFVVCRLVGLNAHVLVGHDDISRRVRNVLFFFLPVCLDHDVVLLGYGKQKYDDEKVQHTLEKSKDEQEKKW